MLKKTLSLSLLLCVITSCHPIPETPPEVFDTNKLGTVERNITYCTMDGVPLQMDVYYPLTAGTQSPVVIYVHGGGWVEGTKNDMPSLVNTRTLQESGFLIVSVEYRLAPQYQFPAMIQDVKCSVRFLRAHAVKYNIDPAKIGAIGSSAGGHLVSLLGLADDQAGFDVGEYLNYSSRIQAVVDLYGPANLTIKYARKLFFNPMEVFGTTDGNDPIFLMASPVNYATSDDPPFLIFQGKLDTTVPPIQSRMLFKSLQEAGISSEIVMVDKAGHNLIQVGAESIDPSIEEIETKILLFWEKYLK